MPNKGDTTYFKNISSKILFKGYILESELYGLVLKTGVKYRNRVKTKDLTSLAFIMITNILLQGGHFGDISYFSIYVLWMIMFNQTVNWPIFILNHMFGCWNQGSCVEKDAKFHED